MGGGGWGAYIIIKFEKGIGFRIRNKEKGTNFTPIARGSNVYCPLKGVSN